MEWRTTYIVGDSQFELVFTEEGGQPTFEKVSEKTPRYFSQEGPGPYGGRMSLNWQENGRPTGSVDYVTPNPTVSAAPKGK